MFKKFLARNTPTDERKQAKDASFIALTLILGKLLDRSLTGPELSVIFSLDDEQTEVITNLLKEAKTHETTRNP